MTTHWFTFHLAGSAADSEDFSVALYDDGHDCILATVNGAVTVAFHREAPSLREAILSAIESVHRADAGVRVVGVEIDEEGRAIDEAFVAA